MRVALARCRARFLPFGLSILGVVVVLSLWKMGSFPECWIPSQETSKALSALFLQAGSALIGAAALLLSILLFSVQSNFDRLPFGLFRRVSSDLRMLLAFAGAFGLAVLVASLSLLSRPQHLAGAAVIALSAVLAILLLLVYVLSRSVVILNPVRQLDSLVRQASREFARMLEYFDRVVARENLQPAASLDEAASPQRGARKFDAERFAFLEQNKGWEATASRALAYAIQVSRKHYEIGDAEVGSSALKAVIRLNEVYAGVRIGALLPYFAFDSDARSVDAFFVESLEHLRRNSQIALARGDELQLQETLKTIARLQAIYISIEPAAPMCEAYHSNLAATHLAAVTKNSVARHPDAGITGVRLLGECSRQFATSEHGTYVGQVATELSEIAIKALGDAESRPVAKIAVEELSRTAVLLLASDLEDVDAPLRVVQEQIRTAALAALHLPAIRGMGPRFCLAYHYSTSEAESFLTSLTKLADIIASGGENEAKSRLILEKIADWSEGLRVPERALFTAAISLRSEVTYDLVHWVSYVGRTLLLLGQTGGLFPDVRERLEKSAIWLMSYYSWIPEEPEVVEFGSRCQVEEALLRIAIEIDQISGAELFVEGCRQILGWGFKVTRSTGRPSAVADSIVTVSHLMANPSGIASRRDVVGNFSRELARKPLNVDVLTEVLRLLERPRLEDSMSRELRRSFRIAGADRRLVERCIEGFAEDLRESRDRQMGDGANQVTPE